MLIASLLVNLSQIFLHNPRQFADAFRISMEMSMPEIPYVSILTILSSLFGAVGLIKYRRWGFYGTYFSYLCGTLVVWFPFFPTFLFQFTSGLYRGVITVIAIYAVLGVLIYLHLSGKKQNYFKREAPT
jgi:hypothetical protein